MFGPTCLVSTVPPPPTGYGRDLSKFESRVNTLPILREEEYQISCEPSQRFQLIHSGD